MRRIFTLLMLAAFGSLLLVRPAGGASLEVVEASVLFKPSTGLVYFDLWFNQPPVFDSGKRVDGDAAGGAGEPAVGDRGLPVEAFQIFVDVVPDEGDEPAFPWEVVARGGEIPTSGGVPIRDAQGLPDLDDPNSGGWGRVLGIADFVLEGERVSFSVPNSWVGVREGQGLSYELLVTEDGQITGKFVPTPTAAVSGVVLLAMMAVRQRRGRAGSVES